MTLIKLALENVRKSFRDFAVYFLTLTLGVSIFYIFNSIESQQSIMEITSGQSSALQSLSQIMANFSIFISIILGFLMIYANRYLITRRKSEFGIYMILGMERRRISQILVLETALVGLIALVAGSVLGVFLSQGMAVVTAKFLGAGIANFQFVFSFDALRKAALYFGLTFILIMIFNVIMVRRQKLIDLIYAARKNEKFKVPHLKLSVFLFLVSVFCLAAAYIITLNNGLLVAPLIWLSVALGGTGTFLCFLSLSGFFLKIFQQSKRVYLSGLNMFVLRQINSKIHTTYISITLVCIMLFISICTLSSGMGLAKAVTEDVLKNAPYDATLSAGVGEDHEAYPETGVDLAAKARRLGVDFDSFAKEMAPIRYYNGDTTEVEVENLAGQVLTLELHYVKLSEYNNAMRLQGASQITLGAGDYAVNGGAINDEWVKLIAKQMSDKTLAVGGVNLNADTKQFFARPMEVSGGYFSGLVVVVQDELLANAPAKRDLLNIQYTNPHVEETAVESLTGVGDLLETKVGVVEHSSSTTTTISYLAVYLGVIFLIASATVLAITQLSAANDNAQRYRLLHKIGTDDKMIYRAGFWQILIYFGVPLVLALVHSIVGLVAASKLIESFHGMDVFGSSLITAVIIVVIYGGYFLVTYLGSKNAISREYSRQENE
jgi:putative ABC transport system permease protein